MDVKVARDLAEGMKIMHLEKQCHNMLRQPVSLIVLVAIVGALLGCSSTNRGKPAQAPESRVALKGAGSTLVSLLFKHWFLTYQNKYPGVTITYASVGSGEGIRRFIGKNLKEEEMVDFGASDAALNNEQIASVSTGVVLLPVAAGGVVLAYNLPDFEGDLRLSRKAYTGIFLGEVRYWNDPLIAQTNPGKKLPKLEIITVVRQDGSGTTFAFTKHLDAISEKWHLRYGPLTRVSWPGTALRAPGNEGVAGRIKESIGSIGYTAYAFAKEGGLKMALLENKEREFVKPTEQSCAAAFASAEIPEDLRLFIPDPAGRDSYPIVTLTWALLYSKYEDSKKAAAVRDLFRWCLLDGQKYSSETGYLELPQNIAARTLTALKTITP